MLCVILLLWAFCRCTVFVNSESGTFPTDLRQMWLDLHNDLRATKLPIPAAGMPKLSWNEDMAQKALATAQKCVFAHDNVGYGENLYKDSGMARTMNQQLVTESIRLWGNERFSHHVTSNGGFMMAGFTDHWTQVVSDRTTSIGCAYSICPSMRLVVCNYIPLGNIRGLGTYKTGPPCSACPPNTVCENGLCANKNAAPIGNGVTLNNVAPPPPQQNGSPKPPAPPPPPSQKQPPSPPDQSVAAAPLPDSKPDTNKPDTNKPDTNKPAVCVPKSPADKDHPPLATPAKALQPPDLVENIPLKLPGIDAVIIKNTTDVNATSSSTDTDSENTSTQKSGAAAHIYSNGPIFLSLFMLILGIL